jgi:hypothetical protein
LPSSRVVANVIEYKTMTDFERINYTVTNSVATIQLNHPKAIAGTGTPMTLSANEETSALLEEIVVILRSAV